MDTFTGGRVWFGLTLQCRLCTVDCEKLSFKLLCRLSAECKVVERRRQGLVGWGWSSVGVQQSAGRQLDASSSESSFLHISAHHFHFPSCANSYLELIGTLIWESCWRRVADQWKFPASDFLVLPCMALYWKHNFKIQPSKFLNSRFKLNFYLARAEMWKLSYS